jgi:hypothetical protein
MGCLNVITISLFLISKLGLFLKCKLIFNYKEYNKMAGYRDINGASQIVKRNVNSVDLQQENRFALESTMVAMAAGGRVQEMALIAQTLEKVNTNANLTDAIADLTTVVTSIKTMNQPQTHDTDEVTQLRAENARLQAQLDQ